VDLFFEKLLKEAFSPRERLPIVEWCEKHIRDIPYSPLRGNFSRKTLPMLAPVLTTIADFQTRRVIISACVQSGKTLAPELALCFLLSTDPAPALWLDIIDESAKDQAKSRLLPLFQNCEPMTQILPADKTRTTFRAVEFTNGARLWIGGANNKNNLQRRSIRYVFGDETWLWKKNRMKEAEARTTAFGSRGKCVFMSQGSFVGDDTALAFEESDRREWTVLCPHCNTRQPLSWRSVEWNNDAKNAQGEWNFERVRETIAYHCPHCGKPWENSESARAKRNATGEFVAQNPNPRTGTVGFHWNALATMDLGDLAEEYLTAVRISKRGDRSSLQAFYQKRLAEPWGVADLEEDAATAVAMTHGGGYKFGDEYLDEAVFSRDIGRWISQREWNALEYNREPDLRLRFMTVDVQDGYFYYVVRAWTRDGSSRLVARNMVIDFASLEEARKENRVASNLVFIDAGFKTQLVKNACAARGWIALKGDRRTAFPHRHRGIIVQKPFSVKQLAAADSGKTASFYFFSTAATKDTLAEIRAGKTSLRWEIPQDIDVRYIRQLNAEYFDAEKRMWICPQGKENHFFDCESMQIAAALINGVLGNDSSQPK